MNNQTQITPEMLIFIAGIFSLFLIGFTLVIREMVKAMSKDDVDVKIEKNQEVSRIDNDVEWILAYKSPTPGLSIEFMPMVTLKGYKKLDGKDSAKFHELMNELKIECIKLKVHFKGEVYDLSGKIKQSKS